MRTNERVNEIATRMQQQRDWLVPLVGDKGRIAELMKGQRDLDRRIRALEQAVAKGYVLAGGVAAVSAAILSAIVHLAFGG
jgi:hypothetical protein